MHLPRLARFAVVFLALLALVPNSAALADKPVRESLPFETDYVEGACSFDVKVESLFNKAKATTFFDKQGNVRFQLLTGALKLRLTNLSTGEFVDENNQSLVRIVPQSDGTTIVRISGPFVGVGVPGFPPLFAFHGKVVLTIDASGALVSVTRTPGPVTDFCATLAS